MNIKEFLVKNKEASQLTYGVILIILIPLLIAFNTLFIINKYNKSLDITLQRQALSLGRSISTLMKGELSDDLTTQKKVDALTKNNPELEALEVLKPEGEGFQIISSSNKDNVGKQLDFYYYNIAWMQKENEGLATDSLLLASREENEIFRDEFNGNDRFWLIAMPMVNETGEKTALLTMRISSKIVDDLTSYNRNISVYLLIATILIVILFLMVAVRLWDYALLYKKIKEVDQMKDEFISMASHELRTPVTGIRGYTEMILDGSMGDISEETKESLNIVKASSERLALLVEDLLNVSRIEQGRIDIDMHPGNVMSTIRNVVNELAVQAKEKGLELNIEDEAKDMPQINFDKDRMKQILINLLGNSIKYTKHGKVSVFVETKNNGKEIEIKIKDTGIGMSAKEREKLFEKFYRVKNEKTADINGTGLGMWITKQLVELMHGQIFVDSIENVGTQVSIVFPKAN